MKRKTKKQTKNLKKLYIILAIFCFVIALIVLSPYIMPEEGLTGDLTKGNKEIAAEDMQGQLEADLLKKKYKKVPGRTIITPFTFREDRYIGPCDMGITEDLEAIHLDYSEDEFGTAYVEICNEPDESTFGVGANYEERARNYGDYLKIMVPKIREKNPDIKVVFGGLSGYNYEFIKVLFEVHPDICQYFDIWNYHPFHLGVAPDEVNTDNNAWHSVEQWYGFYNDILRHNTCLNRKFWVTEFGYVRSQVDAEIQVDPITQASHTLKQYILHLSLEHGRVIPTSHPNFKLTEGNRKKVDESLDLLLGGYFLSYIQGESDPYCPSGNKNCFYNEDRFFQDTGKSIFGLRRPPEKQRVEQVYRFKNENDLIDFKWNRGETNIKIYKNDELIMDLF